MPATLPHDNGEEKGPRPGLPCTEREAVDRVREIRGRIDRDRQRERHLLQRIVIRWHPRDSGQSGIPD